MSRLEEIPAFSIWEALNVTIATLMTKSSEKSDERLAKIIKSGDFLDTFVCKRDPSVSFEDHQTVADKFKSFTTWFLGRFFYLLSCEKLSKSHSVYVDTQLCVLDRLSNTELHVYSEMADEYCQALNTLSKFLKSGHGSTTLNLFIPVKYTDLCERLNLDPVPIEINRKNCDSFLANMLKFIKHILRQSFEFTSFNPNTSRCLDDLLWLLSQCSFAIKLEILVMYLELTQTFDWGESHYDAIKRKLAQFAAYFQQTTYEVYNKKFEITAHEMEMFESLLLEFLQLNVDKFTTMSEFVLMSGTPASTRVKQFCAKHRRQCLYAKDEFGSYVAKALLTYDTSALCGLKSQILGDIAAIPETQQIKLFESKSRWRQFYRLLLVNLDKTECSGSCKIPKFIEFMTDLALILTDIIIRLKHSRTVYFFDDVQIWTKSLFLLNQHFGNCETNVEFSSIYDFFLNMSFVCRSTLTTSFDLGAHVFTNTFLSQEYVESSDYRRLRKELNDFCQFAARILDNKDTAFDYLNAFISRLSSGLLEPPHVHDIEAVFMTISKQYKTRTIGNLPNILTLFTNTDRVISEIVIPALASSDEAVLIEITRVLPLLICTSSSDFVKLLRVEDDTLNVEIYCNKCQFNIHPKSNDKNRKLEEFRAGKSNSTMVEFARIDLDQSALTGAVLKNVLKFLTYSNVELKLAALDVLPFCANHLPKFYSGNVARIWVEKSGDQDEQVRRRFAQVVGAILKHAYGNKPLAETASRGEVVDILFASLLKLAKKSLQHADAKLQETVLVAVSEIGSVHGVKVLELVIILVYFIMVPTSKLSMVAFNALFRLAERNASTTSQLYRRHKRELCEVMARLCVVNQTLVGWSLSSSLSDVATAFQFYNAEDFMSQEAHHLLPFFVARVIRAPKVGELIEQLATTMSVSVAHLVARLHGHIFISGFLSGSKDDFKTCTHYVENTTGLTQVELCRRNISVILNELLLNFHEKREKVLLAMRYLAKDDKDRTTENVQEYLQARLLGILQHFDFKLMAKNTNKKNSILLSLADLLEYMGPTYVGPVRFKIIAMLRTADCGDFPELVCQVWDAFIKSCDVEALGPQLATIFVSLLPLIRTCPKQINDIFKYLVIVNEKRTEDYIKDLFFLDDPKIDASVIRIIQQHVKAFDDASLKDKMKSWLKYLGHETSEVRVRSLKRLKSAIETNREELDRLILGYNGIDPTIVELIEILTRGCREKDAGLRLTCGEVIGVLGAVEPSHLPRRYAQNSRTFTFFLSDDAFIVASLNELTRALQGEKNTVNMDRFAVAIQEILKHYEISSDESSARNDLWKQFPEGHQQLMAPFLTSKYIVSQLEEVAFPSPIYGSSEGATFQAWLYNWTRSFIVSLSDVFQAVLTPCLPAMRNDTRILMQFLPHISLHSIISETSNRDKAFDEITAVIDSFNTNKSLDLDVFDEKPHSVGVEDRQIQSTRVVFIVLDFLDRWTREWVGMKGAAGRADGNYLKLKSFLERFSKLQLAKCSFRCGEYHRALMYLEDHVTSNPPDKCNHLTFLAEIYAQLDEPDGIAGVTASQDAEPPLEQRILALEVAGKLSDAAACYERMPQPLKPHHIRGLIQCYLDLDNANTALNFAQGVLDRQPQFGNMLFEMQAEPLWRLGRYDDLDRLLENPQLVGDTSWGVQIGKTLLAFQKQDRARFDSLLRDLTMHQVELLGGTSLEAGAYQHGYSYVARLHALNELQQVERATFAVLSKPHDHAFVAGVVENLRKEWELRIKVVQDSVRIVEPLLCLRRVAIGQAKRLLEGRAPNVVPLLNSLLGDYWLLSARNARAAGVHQQGYTYTLKAEEYAPTTLFLEKSKLYWSREEHEHALMTLRRGLEVLLPEQSNAAIATLSLEKRKICAEAKLLIARYNDAVSNVDTDIKTANYKEATKMYKEWEVGLVSLAQFYDRRFQNYSDEDRDTKGSEMQIWMISYFCKSLQYGTAFVYQSLPRLLSIWFDYGTRLLDADPSVRNERKNNLIKMTKLIDYASETLPAYVLLTAFSQLVSRICHPQKEVYVELKSIIIKLLRHYPQHSLWMMISVMRSCYPTRAKRCAEIFADAKLKTPSMTKLVRDFTDLAEKLTELCNKKIPNEVEVTSVSALLRALPRLLNKPGFSEIMIPTHKFRKLVLPNPDFSSGEHNPFPNRYVHIVGIDEKVTLLRSLQRPRKITLRGSDGNSYIQMLKPMDDLRKDARLMEFNDIVNQLLSQESEARQRRLYIRLYSVVPLNEECGLIEWVPNLIALRIVLNNLYRQKGGTMTAREVRDASCASRDPLSKKREVFMRVFLPKHPPILGEWFRRTFPDAQSWFFARTSYIRTTAVMSMVGYILGLGDRHGENLLLDSISGDAVHVDFNCLFNKGETFEWPERVPFRLTQNMVAAMGPLGVEGVFRKSCACTLKVLRTNANTLMSIVTPFVYDPLVSWTKKQSESTNIASERTNEQAMDHVKNIELRLKGIIVKTRDRSVSIPLSIEGQTNSLINEAISIDNLCQMYIGWGPYL